MVMADIGLVGLAVMGQNLILNMNDHGFTVACFNRTTSKVDDFINGAAKGTKVIGCKTIKEFVGALKKPRKIMMMVKAGEAVDDLIQELMPFLDKGDILIDGGNSHFVDTERRCEEVKAKGLLFVGCGVSGGEEGARNGPSMMPGGHIEAWETLKPIIQTIAAKTPKGEPCADWLGNGGAGHFVKMVHNGIEYGDIQIICEAYDIMQRVMGLKESEMAEIFRGWNKGELDSFLIEITANVLAYNDVDGRPLVSKILDVAGAKGTGKWTTESALEEGMPLSLIGEAVFARSLSALKEERVQLSKLFKRHERLFTQDKEETIDNIRKALYASKIMSYTQGYMLMRAASNHYKWDLNYGNIALIWQNGCIIRSVFLSKIKEAFDRNPNLQNLLYDDFFKNGVIRALEGWRKAVILAVEHGVPTPCFSAAISWFDGASSERLPANLLQALRDYFGAHTYERVDKPRGVYSHTNWTGLGGNAASGSYNA
ncbi:MAG: decarboxylating NADP(+)-dependent phosphogluconate dehydrogenase [Chlamydiae bacterium]|jgi:6-phosphogluconate dehydrogenase|nr:decarboxylating NADP(+)-dependent phosphogluconate dehydrogenase [Chlamydiota bacterium]